MKSVFIVAGGTGGHINAALSMGDELSSDYEVIYLSGKRYLDYQLFKNKNVIHLDAKPLRSSSPMTQIKNIICNLGVFGQILFLCIRKRPVFAIGAGGYVCGPSLLAVKLLGRKVFIIEQNAIVGLTNRLLAGISTLVFTNFKETKGLAKIPAGKIKNCGNPIRKSIKYSPNKLEKTPRILIFGGSLGATQINEAVQIILNKDLGIDLEILHQTGKDNKLNFDDEKNSIIYNQCEFIDNMNAAYKWANIIIARAGASTVSELRIVRKPAILIPFPGATDNHQYLNAKELASEGHFHCDVLDHTLSSENLALAVVESIKSIQKTNLQPTAPDDKPSASSLIKKEILACLD